METNINNGTGNQVAVSKVESLKSILTADSVQAQFKNALGDNTAPFIASLMELFSADNYLQNCEPKLVIKEALKAAILKLPIIKSLGQAYIIPYKNSQGILIPTFQIGYKGLVQLAIRTQQYKFLNADVVYKGEYRTKNKLTGEFDLSGTAESDEIIGYFSHFELHSGFSKTWYMTKEQVTKHGAKYSKSYNQQYSPWKTEFDKMAIKTVLTLNLSHWGFLSAEMLQGLDDDDLSQQVRDEIKDKGNIKNMDFQQPDVLSTTMNGSPQQEFGNTQQKGPDF